MKVKYDRYRLRLERDGDRVRLITRGGHNWTGRYPWIVEAARRVRQKRFVLDGEAVVLGVAGVSDFNALHSRKHDDEVRFCAFDILVEGDDDLRKLPLHLRKTNLERLLARRPEGIFVNPCERGEIGPDLFRAPCGMGLEGLASKRRDRPYEAGRQSCDDIFNHAIGEILLLGVRRHVLKGQNGNRRLVGQSKRRSN